MTEQQLESVHHRMRTEAEEAGGRIDAIYYCPHGWDAGCECRKPKPGMLFQAQREHHLDLTRTTFVGDDERDEAAADAAGCRFSYASEDVPLLDVTHRLLAGEIEEARR
jgi:D-glycero-D-manno-heptose 1,7-bisphosphate phosphatase